MVKTYAKVSYFTKLQIGTAQTDRLGAKIGPKNGSILMKLDIYRTVQIAIKTVALGELRDIRSDHLKIDIVYRSPIWAISLI